MQQYHWRDCPMAVRSQLETFMAQVRLGLGSNLVGIYLHGSLAMGCFNPDHSDLDLLMVTENELSEQARREMRELLLSCSANPYPIEISSLTRAQLHPWRYPTPFDFHYSESHRARFEQGDCAVYPETDPDLAAHITILKARGVCLHGLAIEQVFPAVPALDYRDAIMLDFESARKQVAESPVYAVLNMCRVYWYFLEKAICSKAEAGEWASAYLPEPYHPPVQQALAVYRGEAAAITLDEHTLRNFVTYLTLRVHQMLMIEKRRHETQ